jgi:hypothetical protein
MSVDHLSLIRDFNFYLDYIEDHIENHLGEVTLHEIFERARGIRTYLSEILDANKLNNMDIALEQTFDKIDVKAKLVEHKAGRLNKMDTALEQKFDRLFENEDEEIQVPSPVSNRWKKFVAPLS